MSDEQNRATPSGMQWELSPSRSQPGDPTEIRIIDREGGPGGRTVCVITGNLLYRVSDGLFDRLLDEDDIANARLIAAAPAMHRTLAALITRARETGGLDPDVLRQAEGILTLITKSHD